MGRHRRFVIARLCGAFSPWVSSIRLNCSASCYGPPLIVFLHVRVCYLPVPWLRRGLGSGAAP
jgi:hypothetical protein